MPIKEHCQVARKRDLLADLTHIAVDELVPCGDVVTLQELVERDGPVARSFDLYGLYGPVSFGEELNLAVAMASAESASAKIPQYLNTLAKEKRPTEDESVP